MISVCCEALHIEIQTANDESKRTRRTISSTDFDRLLSSIKKYINRLFEETVLFSLAYSTSDL